MYGMTPVNIRTDIHVQHHLLNQKVYRVYGYDVSRGMIRCVPVIDKVEHNMTSLSIVKLYNSDVDKTQSTSQES